MASSNNVKMNLIKAINDKSNKDLLKWLASRAYAIKDTLYIYFEEYDFILVIDSSTKDAIYSVERFYFIDSPKLELIKKSITIKPGNSTMDIKDSFDLKFEGSLLELTQIKYEFWVDSSLCFESKTLVKEYIKLDFHTKDVDLSLSLQDILARENFLIYASNAMNGQTIIDFISTSIKNSGLFASIAAQYGIKAEHKKNSYDISLAWVEMLIRCFTEPSLNFLMVTPEKRKAYLQFTREKHNNKWREGFNFEGKNIYELLNIPVGFEYLIDSLDSENYSLQWVIQRVRDVNRLLRIVPHLDKEKFEKYLILANNKMLEDADENLKYLLDNGYTIEELHTYCHNACLKITNFSMSIIHDLAFIVRTNILLGRSPIKVFPADVHNEYTQNKTELYNMWLYQINDLYQKVSCYRKKLESKSPINLRLYKENDKDFINYASDSCYGLDTFFFRRDKSKKEHKIIVKGNSVFLSRSLRPSEKDLILIDEWAKKHHLLIEEERIK